MAVLELPHTKYKESFIKGMDALINEGLWWWDPVQAGKIQSDFDWYVELLTLAREAVGLPEEYVPYTDWWIIENDRYCGHISLRHKLSPNLEKLGGHIGYVIVPEFRRRGLASYALTTVLQKAKDMGFKKALLTCNDDNAPSVRLIEKHGGILTDKIQNPGKPMLTRRYWIHFTLSA